MLMVYKNTTTTTLGYREMQLLLKQPNLTCLQLLGIYAQDKTQFAYTDQVVQKHTNGACLELNMHAVFIKIQFLPHLNINRH